MIVSDILLLRIHSDLSFLEFDSKMTEFCCFKVLFNDVFLMSF